MITCGRLGFAAMKSIQFESMLDNNITPMLPCHNMDTDSSPILISPVCAFQRPCHLYAVKEMVDKGIG